MSRLRGRRIGAAPVNAPPLVALKGVGVERAGRWLVHDVDLLVHEAEIVTLIGPNGGGKTTIVRALLGLVEPDAGTVERRRHLRIGYVPQRLGIDATLPLSVERLMCATMRHSRDDVRGALEMTGVAARIDQPVQHLSGGEFQRVLLARALLRRPELLVLDEPVQGVDYAGESALYELVQHIRERLGCGVLLVSHDLHIVMGATDRVVCLNQHVCCTGAPRDVRHHTEYRRLFGARAASAFAVYEHAHDHDHSLGGQVLEAGDLTGAAGVHVDAKSPNV